jgi:hypothetical protein
MAAGKSGVVASRACGRCERPLSRYNDADYCSGCSKAHLVIPPPTLIAFA